MLNFVKSAGASSLALAFSIFLLTPSVLFIGNADSIDIKFGNFLVIASAISIGAGVILLLVAALTRRLIDISKIYLAIAIAIVAKVVFMPSHVPVLDGETPFAAPLSTAGIMSVVMFVVALAIGAILAYRLPRNITYVVLVALLAMSLQPLLSERNWRYDAPVGETDKAAQFFTFSREKDNVLVILLDGFQSDVFAEIMEEHPDYQKAMQGFTYFHNTVTYAPYTLMAVMPIYSGRAYDGGSIKQFYFSARVDSIFSDFGKQGYMTALGGAYFFSFCPAESCVYRWNLVEKSILTGSVANYIELLEYASLRIAPTLAHDWIYNGGKGRVRSWLVPAPVGHAAQSVEAIETMSARLKAVDMRPTFKFLHLMTTHSPVVLDKNCRTVADRRLSRKNYEEQASCAMRGFIELMNALRAAGIYDNTTVVLMADHGASISAAENGLRFFDVVQPDSGRVGRFRPTFAVKPKGSQAPFALSAAPVILSDLRATLCAIAISCSSEIPGENAFALAPNANRERRFIDYGAWVNNYSQKMDTLPENGIVRYTIGGTIDSLRDTYDDAKLPPEPK